jgi:hypothetical protein
MGSAAVLACDGNCTKAWGINGRAKVRLGSDEDDVAWLADDELGNAPADPGTYEGGHGKPDGPRAMNKWCARECERSDLAGGLEKIKLPDWTRRILNQPWKHQTAQQGVR